MTQFPPAGAGGFGQNNPFGGDPLDVPEPRTSVLAVIAMVLGILGIIPPVCCIPGPGALALILGGLSMIFIWNSAGRLKGTGFALTGILTGLFASVVSLSVLIGGASTYQQYAAQVLTPVGQTLTSVNSGDTKGARRMFSRAADTAISDAALLDFDKRLRAGPGTFVKGPTGWLSLGVGYASLGKAWEQMAPYQNRTPQEPQFMPVPIEFSSGYALVILELDDVRGPGALPPVVNIGVFPADGSASVWLLDPKESAKLRSNSGTSGSSGSSGSSGAESSGSTQTPAPDATPAAPADPPKPAGQPSSPASKDGPR